MKYNKKFLNNFNKKKILIKYDLNVLWNSANLRKRLIVCDHKLLVMSADSTFYPCHLEAKSKHCISEAFQLW